MTRKNYIAVPRSLRGVSTIDVDAECAPEEAGLTAAGVAAIWSAVEAQYRSGLHPAISVVLRRHGKVVLKRAIGHACGNGPGESAMPPVSATPDTPVCLFSLSKAITAVLVHKLAESGAIGLDYPIADYLPAFAASGKATITVRQLLAHQAGMPAMPVPHPWRSALYDFDASVDALCAAPASRIGTPRYHALTGGFVLGEILRRVTGRELPDLLREWLAEPLGCRHLTYGLPPTARGEAAVNAFTGPARWTPVHPVMDLLLQAPLPHACAMSNEARWLSAVIPAANVYATADEACRVFQMLLDGGTWQGRRLLREETVAELVRPVGGVRFNRSLMLPMLRSSGLMLGERLPNAFGRNNPQAYGHLGLMSSVCWADPARGIAVSILTTGKPYPPFGLREQFATAFAINAACAPGARPSNPRRP